MKTEYSSRLFTSRKSSQDSSHCQYNYFTHLAAFRIDRAYFWYTLQLFSHAESSPQWRRMLSLRAINLPFETRFSA